MRRSLSLLPIGIFDVDASYDGEINARRVVNFGGAQ